MIGQLIQSFKKSWKLRKISKKLAAPIDLGNIEAILAASPKRAAAINELIDLCLEGDFRRQVVQKYKASREDLENIYSILSLQGAGQWAGGHYVAASCLIYAQTLDFLLAFYRSDYKDNNEAWAKATHRLIEYFAKGETGLVY